MNERCDLCGARWIADEDVCRECGTPRPTRQATASPAVVADEATPIGVPGVDVTPASSIDVEATPMGTLRATAEPQGIEAPGSSRRGLMLGLLGLVVVAGIASGGYVVSRGTDDPAQAVAEDSQCPDLEALAGSWVFVTQTSGARSLAKLGRDGRYELEVALDGCSASATLTKTVEAGRKRGPDRIQSAEAALVEGEGAMSFGHTATFELRDQSGRGSDEQFVFAADEQRLVGWWRQRGKRWNKEQLYGHLVGGRDEGSAPKRSDLGSLPCAMQCAVVCDAPRRDDSLSHHALERCVDTCSPHSSELTACGDRKVWPDSVELAVVGPQPTLEDHCASAGRTCDLDPRLGRRRAPSISKKRIDGDWVEAHYVVEHSVVAKDSGALRLALKTTAGWFLSDEIVALGKAKPASVLRRMRLRALALGPEGQRVHVVGKLDARVDGESAGHTVACKLEAGVPRCVHVATRDVSPLPGPTLAVDDDEAGIGVGLYGW